MTASSVTTGTRITLGVVVLAVPLVVWAARLDSRVDRLEETRAEVKQELRDIKNKLDEILARIPLVRPRA